MVRHAISEIARPQEVTDLRQLFVPVDATPASARAVELAIRLAGKNPSQIVLVALLPDRTPEDEEIDAELIRADFMATELGFGMPMFPIDTDEETRVRGRFQHVLLPLQRKVEAAGIPVEIRLLHGQRLGEQFRELLQEAMCGAAVVLSNPMRLYGALRELTSDLWINPACATYVTGFDRAEQAQERPQLGRLLKAGLGWCGRQLHGK
jgi:nucleotide-binding universal stress UspA family protein